MISAVDQARGFDALAAEQDLLGHLAKQEFGGESGDREDGGAVELGSQRRGELGIGDRPEADHIDGPLYQIVFQDVEDGADPVLDVDPAHPLAAGAEDAAEAHAEGREHFLERAALGAEDDTGAELHGTNAGIEGWLVGGFPFAADAGQEAGAGGACFIQDFVRAIAVEADGGGGDEHGRRLGGAGERLGEKARAGYAALADFGLAGLGPAGGHALAGEVNNRVETGDRFWVDGAAGDPVNLVVGRGRAAHQAGDGEATGLQGWDEDAAEKAGSSGDEEASGVERHACQCSRERRSGGGFGERRGAGKVRQGGGGNSWQGPMRLRSTWGSFDAVRLVAEWAPDDGLRNRREKCCPCRWRAGVLGQTFSRYNSVNRRGLHGSRFRNWLSRCPTAIIPHGDSTPTDRDQRPHGHEIPRPDEEAAGQPADRRPGTGQTGLRLLPARAFWADARFGGALPSSSP